MHRNSKLLFVAAVLALGIVQQIGRSRNCTLCRFRQPPVFNTDEFYRRERPPYLQLITYSAAVTVQNDAELRAAVLKLQPGTTLRIAAGNYRGGLEVRNLSNLTVDALDPLQPPVFQGGANAWHFSGCSNLAVRNLILKGQTGNGLNIDDGGLEEPALSVTLEKLQIFDVGPKGNHDGIKLSGLNGFRVTECKLEGWGGQGIDMVGCCNGVIDNCRFEGKDGFTATAGVQTKGGTCDIVIEKCRFKDAGERALNLGGSTGLDFFRPKDARYEATRIIARDNRIEGSLCAAAFVGLDGALFENNTILYPKKWIFRVLQENTAERFVLCRNVQLLGNRIAFHRADVQVEVNVGSGTQADSFEFRGNHWFAQDWPDRSKPKLPVEEADGHYGVDWSQSKGK